MALRQDTVRLLVADDVGVGKTIEALLIIREMLERRKIKRFAIVCLPHLCDQWQQEIRTKLDIDAVIIRSNTQARLDREIQGDTSVFEYYPYQIISIDYIKSDTRSTLFVQQCPELVVVDEMHTCARPSGASVTQQQRFHLVNRIAAKPNQHLVMLTATPHSGKAEEFQSIIGLLGADFRDMDLQASTPEHRKSLARHFVQRKRADVSKWMDEDTPFPTRDAFEWSYPLSPEYLKFFEDILQFARKMLQVDTANTTRKRVHYWTALALLRGVMSSPDAGIKMLNTRADKLAAELTVDDVAPVLEDETDAQRDDISTDNPVRDIDYGFEGDNAPVQVTEQMDWTDYQKRQLREFAQQLEGLRTEVLDQKLFAASIVLDDWIKHGFQPVVFCRYIETANYLNDQLKPLLQKKHPNIHVAVITSELPDDLRRQQIDDLKGKRPVCLIATDCLSEGINLQETFTAVLHYDLPWNPNRLEQREGRVDRYGQSSKEVKACLIYGEDNPIDGIVLDVLLRKVREIKRTIGINVPFPEDSQSIIDTITHALLINPDRHVKTSKAGKQLQFDFGDFPEAKNAGTNITQKIDEAANRERTSRDIFAQNAIKAQEVAQDLKAVDEAIGNVSTVREFVTATLQRLGVQCLQNKRGYELMKPNLPEHLKLLLPSKGDSFKISFDSPTPDGYTYLGRNHPFVEQLCQFVMANTMNRQGMRAARTAVIRTSQVDTMTTIMLFRCRNVIQHGKEHHQIVAEEMLLWGWKGTPEQKEFIEHEQAKQLLSEARASKNMTVYEAEPFLQGSVDMLEQLQPDLNRLAEKQSQALVQAHERFSALLDKQKFQVVYPVLPMDFMGIYVLVPEARA